ncbi:hypothetical protein I3760_10G117500 [Carya illinoinensis]|uniref:Uncharacterized protein n=1 Tax=Carya illinoinensis TaxID=32201 RepID=A0A922DX58_CARIL|nr:hypothetical protein I3760_10G117500 [Carya illinoinensis]KAG6692515.1 hypothetical protein I3842_10G118300 [Carya illinoinensis]
MSSASSSSKVCYNLDCKELKSERPRKGWRLRTGEYAELCDRCASIYEEGRFCETFHVTANGWRCCETCGKQVHCGCIVSSHVFTLLDPGGIECMKCARKNVLWELQSRVPYEVDISSGTNKLNGSERLSSSPLEKKKTDDFSESLMNGSLKLGAREILENGNAGTQFIGIKCEESHSSCLSQQPPSIKEDPSTPKFSLTVPHASSNETNGQIGVRNGRPRVDARGRNHLLSRYWPRFTHQELQQISGDSNSVITPLFEKMLSASDAGRIGRLVLPKKCAEAYFPSISQPEGLPLKVQDAKGKEWIFQFRFWPNNNSRMYVLEGVTPCIQAMQLQAGDIVTFSRLEPEGKLVMGFRKASTAQSSDQDNETVKTVNGVSTHGDAELADPSSWYKVDKSGYIAKEVIGGKSSITRKRKSSTLRPKSKRLRIENEDLIELKLTWEEAQGLLRPSPNHAPSIVVIEGFEFEEYEDAPILGKPSIFATSNVGEKIQWVQCEDCFKWRKLPANALLPSRWTCTDNSWDPERSLCSAAQELTAEQLEDLLPHCNLAATKKLKATKQDLDNVEALEGLDTLANLAILGEGESLPASSQATTKHPRHRPGCSCIVCIQPPSGKGPKHKQTCTCNVCLTVKRRFRTLMLRREKKQSEKEAETTRKKQQQQLPSPEKLQDDDSLPCSNTGNNSPKHIREVNDVSDDEPNRMKSSSPFKGQIDLNIQPEREEELSPGSDSGSMMKSLQDATDRYRQKLSSSGGSGNSSGNQSQPSGDGPGGEKLNNLVTLGNHHSDAEEDLPATLSLKSSGSTPATG